MLTHLWEFLNPHKADMEIDDLSVSDGPGPGNSGLKDLPDQQELQLFLLLW